MCLGGKTLFVENTMDPELTLEADHPPARTGPDMTSLH